MNAYHRAVKQLFQPTWEGIVNQQRRAANIVGRDNVGGLETALNRLREIREDIEVLIKLESTDMESRP